MSACGHFARKSFKETGGNNSLTTQWLKNPISLFCGQLHCGYGNWKGNAVFLVTQIRCSNVWLIYRHLLLNPYFPIIAISLKSILIATKFIALSAEITLLREDQHFLYTFHSNLNLLDFCLANPYFRVFFLFISYWCLSINSV